MEISKYMPKMSKSEKAIVPQRRIETELLSKTGNEIESWRIFKIMSEFVDGFELLRKYKRAVTFFGSSRSKPGDLFYEQTKSLAHLLSQDGFTIITGGGGGVMEAANCGAADAKGNSVGLNINIVAGQEINKYVTDAEEFDYFFVRKVMLSFASEVYIFLPGGFGTLDEFFELITLVQTKRIKPIPIILFGREFWGPLEAWIRDELFGHFATIDESDMQIYHIVDSVEEAHELIRKLVV
jgi:hypothetical protein